MLRELDVDLAVDVEVSVKEQGSGAGGALIDCQNIVLHGASRREDYTISERKKRRARARNLCSNRPVTRATPNPRTLELLEVAYGDFHSHLSRSRDPVSIAHRYPDPRDREVVAFVSALLAYGNVRTILNSVNEALRYLGPSPSESLIEGKITPGLERFRHRFTTGEDLRIVFSWLSTVLRRHGRLEFFFTDTPHPLDSPMRVLLSDFVNRLFAIELPADLASALKRRNRSLRYLVSDPLRGSACKRLNMYLRWMVRGEDGVDLGLWTRIRPSQLILPVDTHLLQTLRALRWTRSRQATWRVAEAATERLRLYAPEDPVRYDFALCHLSMEGNDIHGYVRHKYKRSSGATVE